MKNNNINYEECLNEFKKSLEEGSEFDLLIKGIVMNISTNRIRWFDVGIGDGRFLKKIVDELEKKGFMIEVTGVDCLDESIKKARETFPEGNIIHLDFLETEIKGKYDIFSFNQTLYYFHNKNHVIDKCLQNLAEGGLIIGVCWSKKDAIYKYHQKVFGKWTTGAFTSEDFENLLSKYKEIAIIYNKIFEGIVNFKMWKEPNTLRKNLHVISRIPLSKENSREDFELAEKIIKKQKDKSLRANGVVIAKKSYAISNFTKKDIKEALKKRFPSFQKLIPKIKGDLESLFICSWEKETEYVADYIAPGIVLEICCAAGLKTVILAQKHKVVALDTNNLRLRAGRQNTKLFKVENNTTFINVNAENINELKELGRFDAIYIDVDWREKLSDPIKKQNINPFKTCPRTDKLYKNLRRIYPTVPIIFKVSPFVRVKDLTVLDPCVIEELYIDGKFLSYNVYFDPKIKKSRWQEIHLSNKSKI